jgi:predicted ATPase
MLLSLVATAVGVLPDPSAVAVSLTQRLGTARALLVLDTFEHLVEAAPTVADLLSACPALTVVATSRAALRLRGEREVPVLPLLVRGPDAAPDTLSPAIELFLDRARAVAPTTGRDSKTVELVTDICARLDGMPLAIELAAARVRHLHLPDLLMQLDHRLDALVGGSRDLPPRQQTMRATLEWSYQLLDGSQQYLFRALSVFRGSFARDAAQSVTEVASPAEPRELLTTLSALVDSSLVVIETGSSGQARYRLLEVIREYALERAAESDGFGVLCRRHAEHFVAVAELAEPKLRGAEQRAWYSRLADDEGNFRAALSWAMQAGESEIALRLAASLWMFWRWAGLFDEGRAWLNGALEAGDDCPVDLRCQALWGAGWLAFHRGDYERMGQLGSQMLRILGADDNAVLRRNGLTLVGNGALGQGRSKDAIAALGEALAVCPAASPSWHVATSALNLGTALLDAGRAEQAQPRFENALAIYEQLGDQHFAARTLIALAYVQLTTSRTDAASALVRSAMEISADLGDAWGIAEGLEATATVRGESAPHTAVTLAGAADRLRERISMRQHPTDARINGLGLQRARQRLSQQAFEAAWRDGRGLSAESAIALALG